MGRHNRLRPRRPSGEPSIRRLLSGLAAAAIVLLAASVVVILLLTELEVI